MKKNKKYDKLTLKIIIITLYTWILIGFVIIMQYIIFMPLIIIWTLLFDYKDKKVMLFSMRFFIKFLFFIHLISTFKIDLGGIKKPSGPRIYMLNHASQLDTVLMYLLPGKVKVIVKEIYTKLPFIGWTIKLSDNIYLKKQNDSLNQNEQNEVIETCIDEIKKGTSLLIFPEGTRSKDGNIGRFKTGGFLIAYKTKAEIYPVVLDTWNNIRPSGGPWIRDLKVYMKVLKPYKYEDYKDIEIKDFSKKIKFEMIEELLKIRNHRRKKEKNYYRKDKKYIDLDEEANKKLSEYKTELKSVN